MGIGDTAVGTVFAYHALRNLPFERSFLHRNILHFQVLSLMVLYICGTDPDFAEPVPYQNKYQNRTATQWTQ